MAYKEAFPSSVVEIDGEIHPSYQAGHGNEPVFPHERTGPEAEHLEFEDVSSPTGRNHPVIRAAIESATGAGLQNSAEGSVPVYVKGRDRILG